MVQCFDYVKYQMVNFKVDLCCFIAPVRVGLLIIAYLNILVQAVSLIGLSDGTFPSLLMVIVETVLADNAKTSVPVLAHSVDLAFTVILLCAIYRKDIPLLRLYQRYCVGAAILTVLVYSMIVAALNVILGITLVMDIVFQLYILVLVRSMIVEMKLELKNLELPTIVMSSLISEPKEVKIEPEPKEVKIEPEPEVDTSSDSEDSGSNDNENVNQLETVGEQPTEEISDDHENEKRK